MSEIEFQITKIRYDKFIDKIENIKGLEIKLIRLPREYIEECQQRKGNPEISIYYRGYLFAACRPPKNKENK